MAASYSCDGCGAALDAPRKVGHFVARDYCGVCEPKAAKFIEAEESIRAELVQSFALSRAILVEKFGADLRLLPDTP